MSPRRAARTAALYTLLFGVAIARADDPAPRRPVAVIDLTDTDAGKQLANELGNELNNHQALKPLDEQEMPGALMGQIVDEDRARITDATTAKTNAERRLAQFNFVEAAAAARDGWTKLANASPTNPAVVTLYADLAFILGQAQLGDRKPTEAAVSFAFVQQLNPGFTPDAVRYLPEIVQAFEKARAAVPAMGTVAVNGTGDVWLDGKKVGTVATREVFDAPAGLHVVWLVGADRDPRSKRVTVVAEKKEEVAVDQAPASKATRVRRARVALKSALDASAKAGAMQQIAGLLDVKDAVLITSSNGKTIVQTWRDQAPGFSALRELKNERPIDLLRPLAPPPPKKVKPPDPPPVKILPVESPWYEKNTYRVSGGIVAGVILIGGIILVRSIDRHVGVDPNAGFLTGTMAR